MRIAVINQRLSLIQGGGAVDVHAASGGRFGPDAATAYERWAEFTDWAAVGGPARPGAVHARRARLAVARRRGRCSASG